MSLMSCASSASLWKGYNYFLERRATITRHISNSQYEGTVRGSNGATYDVKIDLEHVRKSACNCPHARGKRIICKHMIALYFTAYPLEAHKYNEQLLEYERMAEKIEAEEERCQQEIEHKVAEFIGTRSKGDLQTILIRLLDEGPEWQWEQFVRDYIE